MDYGEIVKLGEENLRKLNAWDFNDRRGKIETEFGAFFNRRYFDRYGFKFRMIDSQDASTQFSCFGRTFETPILSAALSGMTDITDNPLSKVAAGIKNSGSMMWVGIAPSDQVKDVLAVGASTVRIVKPYKNREAIVSELLEAQELGAIAVGIDIDFFYGAKRGDKPFAPKAMAPLGLSELKELAGTVNVPFILKGVLSAEDAEKAMRIGAGGIVVSNHGGSIIDYPAHPLEVLPEIRQVVGQKIPVFVDSGFRRGSDVMKAIALGADAVLVGWVLVMALAAAGEEGISDMIKALTGELQRIMCVTGCRNISEINKTILVKRDFSGGSI